MNKFTFSYPVNVYFGEGSGGEALKAEAFRMGNTVMLAYGGGSIKKNGIYDELKELLLAAGKKIVEFPGIMSNPTYAKAQDGAALARKERVDFQVHQMEHQLGAYTDCNHGQGLAVLQPVYCRHIRKDAPEKLIRFAKEVFGAETMEDGIAALERLIQDCRLPTKLHELRSKEPITPELLRRVADTSNIIKCNPRELSRDEVYEILMECR